MPETGASGKSKRNGFVDFPEFFPSFPEFFFGETWLLTPFLTGFLYILYIFCCCVATFALLVIQINRFRCFFGRVMFSLGVHLQIGFAPRLDPSVFRRVSSLKSWRPK